jgi:hypothetical protein
MPVNHYFQNGDGIGSQAEQRLHEDLIIEGLRQYGHMVYYLPRTVVNQDVILGEDVASRFGSAFPIEAYMETTDGFAGQQELINKFGLEIREDTTFTIAKRRFDLLVDSKTTLIKEGRPNEGDIIYMPLMNSFFEIQFVEDQEPFFQLGNLPVYKLRVTRWEYSSEELNTGVDTIDEKEDTYSLSQLAYQFSLETATDGGTGNLLLENQGTDTSKNYFINEEYNVQTQSKYADNNDLDTEAGFDTASTADDILDFAESNPFGEPGDF